MKTSNKSKKLVGILKKNKGKFQQVKSVRFKKKNDFFEINEEGELLEIKENQKFKTKKKCLIF